MVGGPDFSTGWKTQPIPRPFLACKEGKDVTTMDCFLGNVSSISQEERRRKGGK